MLLVGCGRVQAGGGHRRGCNAQARALAAGATLEVRVLALALALTPADVEQAIRRHLRVVAQLLAVSQLIAYGQLRQAPEMAGLVAAR